MKKKSIVCICLLFAILMLSACSSERRGVPASLVLHNTQYADGYTRHKITHDVDTVAHVDYTQLELYYKGTYGTRTITVPYVYQYDRASDLWTLLEEGDGISTQVLDERAYVEASPWTGTYEGIRDIENCSYSISFHKIDMNAMTADISYDIYFNNVSVPYVSHYDTVDIQHLGGTFNLHLEIEYPSSPKIEGDALWFWLNIDSGLVPYLEAYF